MYTIIFWRVQISLLNELMRCVLLCLSTWFGGMLAEARLEKNLDKKSPNYIHTVQKFSLALTAGPPWGGGAGLWKATGWQPPSLTCGCIRTNYLIPSWLFPLTYRCQWSFGEKIWKFSESCRQIQSFLVEIISIFANIKIFKWGGAEMVTTGRGARWPGSRNGSSAAREGRPRLSTRRACCKRERQPPVGPHTTKNLHTSHNVAR